MKFLSIIPIFALLIITSCGVNVNDSNTDINVITGMLNADDAEQIIDANDQTKYCWTIKVPVSESKFLVNVYIQKAGKVEWESWEFYSVIDRYVKIYDWVENSTIVNTEYRIVIVEEG